jgi:uncharacterized membrane-anchored protein YjiN (DUF445 family)
VKHVALLSVIILASLWIIAETTKWPAVSAFAEAGLVGALADWFAVVALFRRPLGLPIPHTGIISRQKDRIGRSLGIFLSNTFLTEGALRRIVYETSLVPTIVNYISNFNLSGVRVSEQFKRNLLERVLSGISDWLKHSNITIKLPWYIPSFLTPYINEQLVLRARTLIEEIIGNDSHPLKHELLAIIDEAIERFVDGHFNETFSRYLEENQEYVMYLISQFLLKLAPSIQETLPELSEQVFREMNTKALVKELEATVEKDLQWIRLNGAIVGGIIGLALYGIKSLWS